MLAGASAAVAQDHGAHGHGPAAGGAATSQQPPSYAVSRKAIAYFNTPNRHGTAIDPKAATEVGKVTLDLDGEADVLVTFTSGLAAETGAGCPYSVRALLRVDDQAPVIIKRVNVGAPSVQNVDRNEHDRQPADGAYVFTLPKGRHYIALVMQPSMAPGRIWRPTMSTSRPCLTPSASHDMFLRATHAITRHVEDNSEAFRRMVFNEPPSGTMDA